MEHLNQLLLILNAALEHVPVQTRNILAGNAQSALKALEEALKPKEDGKA